MGENHFDRDGILRVKKEFRQQVSRENSYLFVANHTSIIDIMLMLVIVKNPFVFVGKEELAKIPVFGFFYRRTCILVNRSDTKSKTQVFKQAQRRLDSGLSICIFPEGLVPADESVVLHSFKRGAFKLAIEHQIPIVPMTFYDCKKRFSYTFFSGGPGFLRVKIHEFFETKGLDLNETTPLKNSTYELLYEDLIADQRSF